MDHLYNGKELEEEFDWNWYAYGFRYYDAVVGRFSGVDPIADQFPHVSVFNYAENEPVGHIDLWGLQAVIAVTQVGINSHRENFVIQSTEVQRPKAGSYNHLYSVYSNSAYGDKGKLEIIHNVDTGTKLSKYELPKSNGGFLKRIWDSGGGIEFTLSFGKGMEDRKNPNAEIGPNLDEIFASFGVAKTTGGVPVKTIDQAFKVITNTFQNSVKTTNAINDYDQNFGIEKNDTIYNCIGGCGEVYNKDGSGNLIKTNDKKDKPHKDIETHEN